MKKILHFGRSGRVVPLGKNFRFPENSSTVLPLFLSRRFFYSGLDDRRVQRLRRSGMTFNKPRGRDTLSCSFQSRIRLRPFAGITDFYGIYPSSMCSNHPSQTSDSLEESNSSMYHPISTTGSSSSLFPFAADPWSSTGNCVRLRNAANGDTRSQKIIKARANEEEGARKRKDRYIAVVDLLPSYGMRLEASKPLRAMASSSAERCRSIGTNQTRECTFVSTPQTLSTKDDALGHSMRDDLGDSTYATLSRVATVTSHSSTSGTCAVTHTFSFFPPPIFFPQPHPLYYFSFFQGAPKGRRNEAKQVPPRLPISRDEFAEDSVLSAPSFSSSSSFMTLTKVSTPLERIHFELPIWDATESSQDLSSSGICSSSSCDVLQHTPNNGKAVQNSISRKNTDVSQQGNDVNKAPLDERSVRPSTKNLRRFLPVTLNLLPAPQRRNLQKHCDATLLPVSWTRQVQQPNVNSSTQVPVEEALSEHYYLIPCVEPSIEKREYGREEAQVEMITAYRNILLECAEILQQQKQETYCDTDGERGNIIPEEYSPTVGTKQKRTCRQSRIDILRVPALCVKSFCSESPNDDGRSTEEDVSFFQHEIGKLNYEALLKGFHRLPPESKEALLRNPAFAVELFVPLSLIENFSKAFRSEAWEIQSSTLRPARTALYPGLDPPPSLLAMKGWVGKRPELKEGKFSKGKFLLNGPFYQLDGKPIEEKEVWTEIRVFGSKDEERERIKKENETFNSNPEINFSNE